jgi:hypothetical protein
MSKTPLILLPTELLRSFVIFWFDLGLFWLLQLILCPFSLGSKKPDLFEPLKAGQAPKVCVPPSFLQP